MTSWQLVKVGLTFFGTTSSDNGIVTVSKEYTRGSDVNGGDYFSAPHGFGYMCEGEVTLGNTEEPDSISATFVDVVLQPYNLNGTNFAPAPGQSKSLQVVGRPPVLAGCGGTMWDARVPPAYSPPLPRPSVHALPPRLPHRYAGHVWLVQAKEERLGHKPRH